MLVNWQRTISSKKRCFLLCSENQPLSGMGITLPTLPPGRMFEQTLSLDNQMDETISDTVWKWNTVLEEMEEKFETSHTVSSERLIKADPMF